MTRGLRNALVLGLKLLLAAGIIVWLIRSDRLRRESFQPVLEHCGRLAACVILLSGVALLAAVRWRLLLGCMGFRVPFRRVLHLGVVGLLFNCFGVGYVGGDVVKAYYAAGDQPAGRRAEAVTTVVFDRFVGLMGLLLLALFAGAIRPGSVWNNPAAPQLRFVGLVLLAVFAAMLGTFLLTFSRRLRESPGLAVLLSRLPGGRLFLRVYLAAAVYRTRPSTVLAAVGISILAHAMNITIFWQLAQAVAFPPIDAAEFAFYIALGLAASSVGLPLGIGVGQVVFGYLFSLLWGKHGDELGNAMATLQQGLALLFNLTVGLPAFLLIRGESARVRQELAEDAAAEGTFLVAVQPPAGKSPGD
jgi:glycosyltransferase 2 family protein